MAYLSINGVTVSVAADSVSLRYVGVGGSEERSPSGSLEGGPLVLKREWSMATTPVPASEVDAWVGLIEGKGHSIPFDADFYSHRGRGPVSSAGASIVLSGAKHGAGYFAVGLVDELTYGISLPSTWTVLLWRLESGTWKHYLTTYDSRTWLNGVRDDEFDVSPMVMVVNGSLVVGDPGGDGLGNIDDVVALPYSVPDAWAPSMYAQHNAAAWPALPRVTAAGDFATSSVTVRGRVTDSRVSRCAPAGTLTSAHTIQFTLREV